MSCKAEKAMHLLTSMHQTMLQPPMRTPAGRGRSEVIIVVAITIITLVVFLLHWWMEPRAHHVGWGQGGGGWEQGW